MRAVVYHGRRDVRVEDVPEPGPLGDGQVRLRVVRAALCGTDAAEYAHGPTLLPLNHPHPGSGHRGPTIIGHEFVGEVEAVGAAVEHLTVGQRVVPGAGVWCGRCALCRAGRPNLCTSYYTLGINADGGMTERINVPAAMCAPVPDECSDDAAAIAQPLAVALHAVRRANVQRDELALLIGVGGIGFFLLAGLLARGARVIAVDVDPEKLAAAARQGAAHTVDASAEDVVERVTDLGGPVDVALEASGAAPSPALAQRLVRTGGRVVLVGLQREPRAIDLADLVLREVDVVTSNAHVCAVDLPEALTLLAIRRLSADAVDRVVGFDAVVAEGLEPLAAGDVSGKVLVDPWA